MTDMAIKFVLILAFVALGTTVGVAYSGRLTSRRRYFEEIVALINSISGDIKFRQATVATIVSEGEYKAIKPTTDAFVRYVTNESKDLKIPRQELSEREYTVIVELFSALGTYDLDTQLFVLDNYKAKINEFYASAKDKENKYAATAIKLGVLIGLGVGVVVL